MNTIEMAAAEAEGTPIPQIVMRLQGALGQRLVAFAAGIGSPRTIGAWARGESDPGETGAERVRALFLVYRVLTTHDDDRTIRAWLIGLNPDLGEAAPIDLLRAGAPAFDASVIAAAGAFTH